MCDELMVFSMRISHDLRRDHAATVAEMEAGMAEKSREFAESGNRIYLPLTD
jgi:phosphomethylpyrimidine synthase